MPGIVDPLDFLQQQLEYRQGSLLTRAGKAQDFRRRIPFISSELVTGTQTLPVDLPIEQVRVSRGQLSLPVSRPNLYRAGATVRAVGPDLADIAELSRFQQPVMRRPAAPGFRMPLGGALVGLSAGLMDPRVAAQLEANEPIEAAATVGQNVVIGGAVGDVVRNVVQQATKASPATQAKVMRMAGILSPVVLGAGLFMQGKSGSPIETALRKSADVVPGLKPEPSTDIGRSASNEARYIIQSLIKGRLPYSR